MTITKEQRIAQSNKIVNSLLEQFFLKKHDYVRNDDGTANLGKIIMLVYNEAVDDVLSAIDTYAEKNAQHRLAFGALKAELTSWMPLIEE